MRAVALLLFVLAGCAEERRPSQACEDCAVRLHPAGILDPHSEDFHGKLLADINYDFGRCSDCHGDDFGGGKTGVSCLACHEQGPTDCSTCHGPGHEDEIHARHRNGQIDCAECHRVPAHWDEPGHIVDDDPPAEVQLGARAAITIDPGDREGVAAWDGERCSNVYCHGDVRPAFGGTDTRPRWDQQPAEFCSSGCHGLPPPDHVSANCIQCHAGLTHVDGVVQVTSGCSGCHGSASSPAPPVDLDGNQFTTAIGVGAHQAHLQAPSGLRPPIACETCHVVPALINAPGHIDDRPAEVKADVGWNRTTETCTTWCHGVARPRWTSHGEVVCGSCHGAPPLTPPHTPDHTILTCSECHVGPHMNGVLDGL